MFRSCATSIWLVLLLAGSAQGFSCLQGYGFQIQGRQTLAAATGPHPFAIQSSSSSEADSAVEEEAGKVPLVIEGKNLEVTDALYSYVDKRIGMTLKKLSGTGNVLECDVILSVSKNPKVRRRPDRLEWFYWLTLLCVELAPAYRCFDRHL